MVLDYLAGDKLRTSFNGVQKVCLGISCTAMLLAAAPLLMEGAPGGTYIDVALVSKILCGLLSVFFLQFLLVPGFFLNENFAYPPAAHVFAENYSLVCFFMRLLGMIGGFMLYLVYTSPPEKMYPVLCAFTFLCAFMGPIKAELCVLGLE